MTSQRKADAKVRLRVYFRICPINSPGTMHSILSRNYCKLLGKFISIVLKSGDQFAFVGATATTNCGSATTTTLLTSAVSGTRTITLLRDGSPNSTHFGSASLELCSGKCEVKVELSYYGGFRAEGMMVIVLPCYCPPFSKGASSVYLFWAKVRSGRLFKYTEKHAEQKRSPKEQ